MQRSRGDCGREKVKWVESGRMIGLENYGRIGRRGGKK